MFMLYLFIYTFNLFRLKNAIHIIIPLVIEQYNLECSKVLDKRYVLLFIIKNLI